MQFIDPNESRDRRLQMLLTTATSLQQMKQQKEIANQENDVRLQTLAQSVRANDLQDPSKNKYLRAEMATQNRERLAKAKRYESGGGMGTPRFMQDDEGNLVPLPGILVETPQQKMDRKNAAPTADSKNQLQANQNAVLVFDELKKLSSGLESIGGYEGIVLKGQNIISRGKASPQAQSYMDFMPAASVNLYRGITGDTRLSDYDANRAYKMVWDIDQDGNVKGLKEGVIESLLAARNVLLSNNVYATKKEDKITSIEDVLFVANASRAGASQDEIIAYLKKKKK